MLGEERTCEPERGRPIARARDNGELIVVSNRLPVQVTPDDAGRLELVPSSGGLVSALRGIGEEFSWIGWPGAVIPADEEEGLRERLAADRLYPVFLDQTDEADFYGRICNETIWPLFHYFVDRMLFTDSAWKRYVDVNERFAQEVAARSRRGARVWVHDFHLMLVPAALRRLRPDLSIGFFLHVPFPAAEVFRLLPPREEVLLGLLGADYLGFHTSDHAQHFRWACLRVLGIDSKPDAIEHAGRCVEIGADPIGIDVARFREVLAQPETAAMVDELAARYSGRRLVLGVERLDYTKGIPQKLRAFERFLEDDPTRAATTTMLQVLVPSRLESSAYRLQRDAIEQEIARINGRFGQPGRTPVEYLHRSVSPAELVALYRRADVMAVTPLRDGMNLVAQEFVLCQAAAPKLPGRARGVLLLSEFAGAAHVLPGALLVNPWDIAGLTQRLVEALDMGTEERRRRLALMSGPVRRLDAPRWAEGFLGHLARATRRNARAGFALPLDRGARQRVVERAARASRRTLLLDYDGTLREIVEHPSLARPTPELLALLAELAALPATDVHIVSGRTSAELEAWLGQLPLALCAEHGYRVRPVNGSWTTPHTVDLSWIPRIERLFRRISAEIPGTHVERKSSSIAWHYRQAEPGYGEWRGRELLVYVEQLLSGVAAEVLRGHRVIEVRARGIHKGTYVRRLFPGGKRRDHFVLSAGDDNTDADVTAAVPAGSVVLHVGQVIGSARAAGVLEQYVAANPAGVRQFLHELTAGVNASGAAPTG